MMKAAILGLLGNFVASPTFEKPSFLTFLRAEE
jgi:hypothetical protein